MSTKIPRIKLRGFCSDTIYTIFQHQSHRPIDKIQIRIYNSYNIIIANIGYELVILSLENVQHRATKLVPALKDLEYTDRLKLLDLPSMAYRRCRGDMIEVYKYLHGQYNVDVSFLPRNKKLKPRPLSKTAETILRIESQT